MELCVQGAGLACPGFQLLLYAALRALIDRLGVTNFNVGIYNIDLCTSSSAMAAEEDKNDAESGAPESKRLMQAVPVLAR